MSRTLTSVWKLPENRRVLFDEPIIFDAAPRVRMRVELANLHQRLGTPLVPDRLHLFGDDARII